MFLCRFISHLPLEPRRADPAVTGCCWGELAAGCSWRAVAVLHVTKKDFSGCLGRAGGKRPPRSPGQPRAHPRVWFMPKHKPGQLWLCAAKSCKSPQMVTFNLSWELSLLFPKSTPSLSSYSLWCLSLLIHLAPLPGPWLHLLLIVLQRAIAATRSFPLLPPH